MTAQYALAVNLRTRLLAAVNTLIVKVVVRTVFADIAHIDRKLRAISLHRGTEALVHMLAGEHQVNDAELRILCADRADIVQKGIAAARAHQLHKGELCAFSERHLGLYARKPLCICLREVVHDHRERALALQIEFHLCELSGLCRRAACLLAFHAVASARVILLPCVRQTEGEAKRIPLRNLLSLRDRTNQNRKLCRGECLAEFRAAAGAQRLCRDAV